MFAHFYESMTEVNALAWRMLEETPSKKVVHVMERSMFDAVHAFIPVSVEEGHLSGFHHDMMESVYRGMFRDDYTMCPLLHASYLFLDVDANVCCERIKTRDRQSEEGIPQKYIEKLDAYHRTSLMNKLRAAGVTVFSIDGTVPLHEVYNNTLNTLKAI